MSIQDLIQKNISELMHALEFKVSGENKVWDVWRKLKKSNMSFAPVYEGDSFVGFLDRRTIEQLTSLTGATNLDVFEVMDREFLTVHEDEHVLEVLAKVAAQRSTVVHVVDSSGKTKNAISIFNIIQSLESVSQGTLLQTV